MPDLPRLLSKKEAYYDPDVREYLLNNWPRSYGYELKYKTKKVKPHQLAVLEKIAKGRWAHKWADTGRRNPIDGVGLVDADALIIVITPDRHCVCKNLRDGSVTEFKV